MCYNMMPGGEGGFEHIDTSGKNNPMKRREVVEKQQVSRSSTINSNKKFYDEISRCNLKKAVEHNIGKKRPKHSQLMKNKMKSEQYRDEVEKEWK